MHISQEWSPLAEQIFPSTIAIWCETQWWQYVNYIFLLWIWLRNAFIEVLYLVKYYFNEWKKSLYEYVTYKAEKIQYVQHTFNANF